MYFKTPSILTPLLKNFVVAVSHQIMYCIYSTITIWIFLYCYHNSEFYIDISVYRYITCITNSLVVYIFYSFGHVEYRTVDEAKAVFDTPDNIVLDGRSLFIDYVSPRGKPNKESWMQWSDSLKLSILNPVGISKTHLSSHSKMYEIGGCGSALACK